MILWAFIWCVGWGFGALVLLLVGYVATDILQTTSVADQLAQAWLFTFNGLIVGATGYGAVFFICDQKTTLLRALRRVIDVPDARRDEFEQKLAYIENWRITHAVALVLTFAGGWIAYNARIPLDGFAHKYLTAAVFSYYAVGTYGLMVFIAILRLFRYVEEHSHAEAVHRISLHTPLRRIEVQTIDMYFIISSAMAIFAVYICFRTTLEAFRGAPPFYYKLMIVPVLFFLPAALVYSFYPRYVLRQIWETDTFVLLDSVVKGEPTVPQTNNPQAELELRRLILEVREKMLTERRSIPLFTFKDAPTLTLAFLMILQVLAQKDPAILRYLQEAVR